MRHMSFALTTEQFLARTKLVTRRMGWEGLRVGELVMGVEKSQGLQKGEKVVKLGPIQVVSTGLEQLNLITKEDCILEGFPDMEPDEFVSFFAFHNGCSPDALVNRIQFIYALQLIPMTVTQ